MTHLHFTTRLWARSAILLCGYLAACNNDVDFAGNSAELTRAEVLLDQEFPAATVTDASANFHPAFGTVEQNLKLKENGPQTATLYQTDRTAVRDSFQQGSDGQAVTQTFNLSESGKLDILVIVDDSDSMKDKQDNLSTKLSSLLDSIKDTDWRMNVITTSSSKIRNDKLITAANMSDFATAVTPGTNGRYKEKGLYTALHALQGDECQTSDDIFNTDICKLKSYSWLRNNENSSIAVLFVTDEDSFCPTSDCKGYGPADFISTLTSLRPNKVNGKYEKLGVYGLIYNPNYADCANKNGAYGSLYQQVINTIGGSVGSVCASDYSNTLKTISQNVKDIVKYDYTLNPAPDLNSVTIKLIDPNNSDPNTNESDYTDFEVVGATLKLKTITNPKSKIKVTYRYQSKPRFDEVVLSADPELSTLEVSVDQQKLSSNDYTFDPQARLLHFNQRPADRANIVINYRKNDKALVRVFSLKNLGMLGQPLSVTVGNQAVSDYEFNAANQNISLNFTPTDGTPIKVSYRAASDRVTDYAMPGLDVAALKSWSVVDKQTKAAMNVSFDQGQLRFAADDVVDGREVQVQLNYADASDILNFELPNDPIEGSVKVQALSGSTDCAQGVTVSGRSIKLSCQAEELDQVLANYRIVLKSFTQFTVAGSYEGDEMIWQVYVDGSSLSNFQRQGSTITIPASLLTPDSKVRIIVSREPKASAVAAN